MSSFGPLSPWFYDPFVIPFTIGLLWLVGVILYKWIRWFVELPKADKSLVGHKLFSNRSINALGEVIMESILHRRIWQRNPVLGYMHTSLALGWLLLIIVGKLETSTYIHDVINPPHVHVFFRYFFPEEPETYIRHFNWAMLMDWLLIFVLSGVLLAWCKRFYSRLMGMRRTTRHTLLDRVAMTSLWLIFPLRFLAESTTCGVFDSGPFFTGASGDLLASMFPREVLAAAEWPLWLAYSTALGLFFVAMPYSRYMHIFTEVPLIFLRHYRIKAAPEGNSFDRFQLEACSRCGVCLDPCPIASELKINNIQAAYFVRDRRYGRLTAQVADTCLMCGRCTEACPVGLELDTLRLSGRVQLADGRTPRYDFLPAVAVNPRESLPDAQGKVGFFAGCMTQLTPTVLRAMEKIFAAAGVAPVWLDREGGVCCGRPMRLSGNLGAARKMADHNSARFEAAGITTLVTGCPICYKSFTTEYDLERLGIRVLHHSQYIAELIASGHLKTSVVQASYAYHDPCELRGIHSEPRYVLAHVATLHATPEEPHCCGGSLANLTLETASQVKIGARVVERLAGADFIATACPQCKKSLAAAGRTPVVDISEVVAAAV